MRFELPDCKRCCLCVPLRHGILIFGYLNLFFSIFLIGVQTWFYIHYPKVSLYSYPYRGIVMSSQLWLYYVLYILEVIFNIVLLIGAHRKITGLIRAYYYYGITTTLLSFISFFFQPYMWSHGHYYDLLTICLAFSGLVLQCYLVLLIRTELNKLQYLRGQFQYLNHTAEVIMVPSSLEERGNPV